MPLPVRFTAATIRFHVEISLPLSQPFGHCWRPEENLIWIWNSFSSSKSIRSGDVWHGPVFRREDIKGVSSWSRSRAERFAGCLLPQCGFKYLSEGSLIKLAYPTTKYQCALLRAWGRPVLTQKGDGRGGGGCVCLVCVCVCVCRGGGVKSPPVRLLASAEEAVSLTVSRRRVLTF